MSTEAQNMTVTDNTLGVLGKELRVRVLNCSPSGCLVETNSRLEVGTIASLRLSLQGDEFTDDVQVVRCQQIEGAGPLFHVGAQFLWTGMPHEQSLRQLMRRAATRPPTVMATKPSA
jgi:hypothetical protein